MVEVEVEGGGGKLVVGGGFFMSVVCRRTLLSPSNFLHL